MSVLDSIADVIASIVIIGGCTLYVAIMAKAALTRILCANHIIATALVLTSIFFLLSSVGTRKLGLGGGSVCVLVWLVASKGLLLKRN